MTGRSTSIDDLDWAALLSEAMAADAPLTKDELMLWQQGLIDGNARMWNVEYVHACERAIHSRDFDQLIAMLEARIPHQAFLLPVLGRVVRLLRDGVGSSRPKALSEYHQSLIRGVWKNWEENDKIQTLNQFLAAKAKEISDAIGEPVTTSMVKKLQWSKKARTDLAHRVASTEPAILGFVTKRSKSPREAQNDLGLVYGVSWQTIRRALGNPKEQD